MSNVLSYKYNTVGHTYEVDVPNLKETQKLLKATGNETILALLNNVVDSMVKDGPVVSNFCREAHKWIMTSDKSKNEVSLMKENIRILFDFLKTKNDLKDAFYFDDGNINLWIIVDEATYDTNVEYRNLSRSILKDEYKNINLMIYSFDEIDEVKEELEEIEYISIKEC